MYVCVCGYRSRFGVSREVLQSQIDFSFLLQEAEYIHVTSFALIMIFSSSYSSYILTLNAWCSQYLFVSRNRNSDDRCTQAGLIFSWDEKVCSIACAHDQFTSHWANLSTANWMDQHPIEYTRFFFMGIEYMHIHEGEKMKMVRRRRRKRRVFNLCAWLLKVESRKDPAKWRQKERKDKREGERERERDFYGKRKYNSPSEKVTDQKRG